MKEYKWEELPKIKQYTPIRPLRSKIPFTMDFIDKNGIVYRYYKQTKTFEYLYSLNLILI